MVDPGHMNLYDRMDPPLRPGAYRLEVGTGVSLGGVAGDLDPQSRFLQVEGPRFSLLPQEVAGVFPPRNAVGVFEEALPQVVLGRRTLAWEREADAAGRVIPGPAPHPPLPTGADDRPLPPPWLALLLFTAEELPDEHVLRQVPLSTVLPATVRTTLGLTPADAQLKVDAIDVDAALLIDVLPGLDELQMLTHVREVSTEDRELSAGDSDGWFTVVMGNRLPSPGKWRACLVSVEGRDDVYNHRPSLGQAHLPGALDLLATADVVPRRPPGIIHEFEEIRREPVLVEQPAEVLFDLDPEARFRHVHELNLEEERLRVDPRVDLSGLHPGLLFPPRKQLVLLHTWTFECKEGKSFQELCRGLDVGLFGELRAPKTGERPGPVVTDTGHIALHMTDRAGSPQLVWYRGPLAPWPLTRDTSGPYHSADQCRRMSTETGLEDISYSAAFEVGRLLAAADARLAQELMRWRRRSFRRAVLSDMRTQLRNALNLFEDQWLPQLTERVAQALLRPGRPFADPFDLRLIRGVEGLQPALLARAWQLATPEQAATLLGRTLLPDATGVVPGVFERPGVSGDLAVEPNVLTRLADAWQKTMENIDLRRNR